MTVEGCGSESLQGDVRFAEIMQAMGATVKWHPHEIVIEGQSSSLLESFWSAQLDHASRFQNEAGM